ncbi:MAG TPA: 3-hydroxyacyl-CoA dehydrogenase NAD-binding domain-containing protein [Bacteroidia bacterium]|nr:3-hydroxyacyl-CoA dehydrogenase NAD-binding domain-containing protein [Bacteroidia bacterium]
MTENKKVKNGPVGVVGAGTMGIGIVQVAATAGHTVYVFDKEKQLFERALVNLNSTLNKLTEKGKISSNEAKDIINRILYAENLSEFHECDLVIEAIVEDLSVKQKVFCELEFATKSNCLLASNTSSLSITSIGGACKNASRVLGLHFFNPAPLMPLVEIIPGIETSTENLIKAKEIIAAWKKIPVVPIHTPGFIVNRDSRPFYGEAIRIYEEGCYGLPEGVEGFATIDRAMRHLGGFRMGPFELMDLIGNDINYKVTETVWSQFYNDPRYKPSLTQKRMVEANRFGRKSGSGYYNYAAGTERPEGLLDDAMAQKILDRILALLINEAVDALYLRIASAEDIDLAMTKGVNYPKGLLKWCDEIGAQNVLNTLNDLSELYQEERYRPSLLLKELASTNKKIFF